MESRWILLQFAGVKSGRNKIPPWPLARISLVITEPDTTTQGLLHIWNGFLLPCGGVHAFCKEGKFQIWERNKSGLISSGKVTRSKEGLCSSCGSHRKFTNGLRSRLLASLISAAKLGVVLFSSLRQTHSVKLDEIKTQPWSGGLSDFCFSCGKQFVTLNPRSWAEIKGIALHGEQQKQPDPYLV